MSIVMLSFNVVENFINPTFVTYRSIDALEISFRELIALWIKIKDRFEIIN